MVTESKSNRPVSFFFIPLMTPGHMNPMLNIAKLFALRSDTSVSVITTPGNVSTVRSSFHSFPITIDLITVPFPLHASRYIPHGKENLSLLTFAEFADFFHAFFALQDPIEQILYSRRPDCIVSDYMFYWMSDTAAKLGVPRIVFYGHGIFTSCVHDSLETHKPFEKISDDSEEFVVQGIPHRISLVRSEVSIGVRNDWKELLESVGKSYGVVVNSFYGLEPEYAELYKSGRRRYYVGPVAMVNETITKEVKKTGEEVDEVMNWLNSVEENSVVYACFGSLNEFCKEQLVEIALGLERSGRRFIWAARNIGSEILPEGYEERVKGVGVVIKGWAPQVMMLNHKAIGGFVTHCGWNSTLESVAAGVPMAAWPVEYEQFVNEKLIVEVLRIGVSVRNGERGEKIVKAAFVISDWQGINDILPQDKQNYTYSVLTGISAGIDMVMIPYDFPGFVANLTYLVENNFIPMSRIDDAVRRILRVKFTLGLFENPYADLSLADQIGKKEHRELAREAVRKSLVLLKNGKTGQKPILPLPKNVDKLLVAGTHADNLGYQCGGWTIEWQGQGGNNLTIGTTLLEAVKSTVSPSTEIVYSAFPDTDYIKKIKESVSYAIVAVGEYPYAEGAGDSFTLEMAETGPDTIKNVCMYIKCVVIVMSGRPIVMEPYVNAIDALVAAWLPGTEGKGITDVLFGDFGFTGKLARTWFKSVDQLPMNVGDRHYDPLYPFGYGLAT